MTIRIAHLADIHYCPKHLEWVDLAMNMAINRISDENCQCCVIAGDSFDHGLGAHEPAVAAFIGAVLTIAAEMPVLVLQGTYSHDRPGTLDLLREMPTRFPILVVDEPGVWALENGQFRYLLPLEFPDREINAGTDAIFCCLPSLNRADPAIMKQGAAAWVREVMGRFAPYTSVARQLNIPSVLPCHGTIIGCLTESKYAMVSPDHEFDVKTLASSGVDAVMAGHVHKHQFWIFLYCTIAYSGSLARLVHGDHDPKGFLIWNVAPSDARFDFIESPTRQLLEIEFDGPPDMDDLADLAAKTEHHDAVRIRWTVDQEYASTVDKRAIRALFEDCDSVKLEGVILPVQSVRSAGISKAQTLEGKLGYWCQTTGDEGQYDGLVSRLQTLQSSTPDAIVERVTAEPDKNIAVNNAA